MATEPRLGGQGQGALTISQLQQAVDAALSETGLAQLWVVGIVTGLRRKERSSSFELVEYEVDATTVRAVLPVAVFGREGTALMQTLRRADIVLEDGLEASFFGRLETNGAYGPLRLVATEVDPRVAIGATVLARAALVRRLDDSGAMAAQRELRVPPCPLRIGLVSAENTAGRADILGVLRSSPVAFHVVEAKAAMSGPNAAKQVAAAVVGLCRRELDVIVLARGGGPRSDLAAWDSEEVARAIAASPVPVWVAVGHATDRTVADLVAHSSFVTPTAAAAALIARARAVATRQEATATAARHVGELAEARMRSRRATVVAAAALFVILVVIILAVV
jgi:exodeoxyribonuclease VII large subunit